MVLCIIPFYNFLATTRQKGQKVTGQLHIIFHVNLQHLPDISLVCAVLYVIAQSLEHATCSRHIPTVEHL
jgi:hypothetical protein